MRCGEDTTSLRESRTEPPPSVQSSRMSRDVRAVFALFCACMGSLLPAHADALEISFGASVGGIQVGTEPRLAVSPFFGVGWHTERGLLLAAQNMFSVVLGDRVGVHDRTSAAIGYAWQTGDFSLGPSLSIYSMLVCGPVVCRRVEGAAPGVQAQVDWYFFGPLGGSLSGNVAWYGGASSVLRGDVAGMVTAGLILRLETR